MAGELKNEVEKTDSAQVLSLALLKKTEEIEKNSQETFDLARRRTGTLISPRECALAQAIYNG